MSRPRVINARYGSLLQVDDLVVTYRSACAQRCRAVAGVSFDLQAAAARLALIGKSGSGKSTIARAICGLGPSRAGPSGSADALPRRRMRRRGRRDGIQIVFQDPTLRARSALAGLAQRRRAAAGTPARLRTRRTTEQRSRCSSTSACTSTSPNVVRHQLSGGQRQRVTIARALAAEPGSSSSMKRSRRSTSRCATRSLRCSTLKQDGLTYLFISHDMGAVAQIATSRRALSRQAGRVGDHARDRSAGASLHPGADRRGPGIHAARITRARGRSATPPNPPAGCRFHPRCAFMVERCVAAEPPLNAFDGRLAACVRLPELAQP